MTERWVSTPKHYCKYCNTWFPDTKVQRQQHELSDRHKRNMQRNIARIQRNDLIARQSGLNPTLPQTTPATGANTRKPVANIAAYGYGDRSDMARYLAEGKKMKLDNIPAPEVPVPQKAREGNVGKWEVTQIITQEKDEKEKDGVKREESPEPEGVKVPCANKTKSAESVKRERARTPDREDLLRFRVEEKTFPTEVKNEDDEVKVPVVGFKKRKIGAKSSRVANAT